MKRRANVYNSVCTYDKVYQAYISTKRGKSSNKHAIEFYLNYEREIKRIVACLKSKNFDKIGLNEYNMFYVYEPKTRKVLAAPFRCRVIHTWYVKEFLEKYYVPSFIPTSYACIKDKGMHMAAYAVQKAMRVTVAQWETPYVIKIDVLKFFNNIDRDILYNIMSKKIKDKEFLHVTKIILNSANSFDEKEGISLPIGNYTSQMFANIYLNEVDQYAKVQLKCKWYYRYMDDIVIICENKITAKEKLEKISNYLLKHLHLRLNSKTNIFKVSQGVNFCGYKITVGRIRIRTRGRKKLVSTLKLARHNVEHQIWDIKTAKRHLAGHYRIYVINIKYRSVR